MSVTVRDVAAAAGVSPGTASRALRGHPQISEDCIARVRMAAERLNYRPLRDRTGRRRAEPLVGRRIAIALFGIDRTLATHPAVGECIHGVEEALAECGAHPVLVNVSDPREPPRSLRRIRFDGIIAKAALQGDIMAALGSKIQTVLSSNALVWILGRPAGVEGDAVSPDNVGMGRMAAEALVDAGHTRLAVVNPKGDHAMFIGREEGFREAAARRAAVVSSFSTRRSEQVFPIQPIMDVGDVQPLVDALLAEQPRPTAIFCPADSIAVMVYRALATRGIRPGVDIAIISCNYERSLIAGLGPSLATFDIHPRQIGRLAVRQLTRRITGEFDGSAVTIDVKATLQPGDSLAPPPPEPGQGRKARKPPRRADAAS
ncbi:MAG: LacI family DNA-binding transcriptional regulator [Planctomycetaceae bacterium]